MNLSGLSDELAQVGTKRVFDADGSGFGGSYSQNEQKRVAFTIRMHG